ncbi:MULTISPECIES: amidophosphoribosyltransferase [unclassified Nitratiruptor]|uniref:amidophosphoribosyltransferase n=1 Tax=unclassified Nitratiruptor TaxID=2624044 RepID=UPI001915BB2E|nr:MULTISPECIES: amidophosphoribosyltransferase [unclassified Nitratiruptor]BCD60850.1 amidophosphoribosyltransferase [Nitratiruptor sp. YY08-10]BCD64782.1 amidophosphoribosyltransferase [Nitratiruptor sp. YY08-14]
MCSVIGLFNVPEAAKYAFYGLFSLQHRGQEAAGIASSDGERIHISKGRGLVTQVFDEKKLSLLEGNSAVGHTRYSTAGDDSVLDAQPIFARYDLGQIAVVHNGNLTNAKPVRKELIKEGAIFQTFMDTENIIHLIARSQKEHLYDRIIEALHKIEGAYSMILLSRKKMFAMRDPYGFRPLVLGRLGEGWVVASETCAFDLIGAEYVRDVKPGELLVFEEGIEPKSIQVFDPTPAKCIFEYIYFARPDSNVFGKNVYELRKKMGRELAKEYPVEADMVVPVPDSGVASAIGYSEESGIPFELGIIRNHYVGRTFIEPTQEIRDLKVKMKLNPIKNVIQGKRLIVIDDSIVRGTTSKKIVSILKEFGAKEVHMRISAPPTTGPCYYGVDTPTKEELISSRLSVEETRKYIGADTLAYLSIPGLIRSVGNDQSYCMACFDGNYPVPNKN